MAFRSRSLLQAVKSRSIALLGLALGAAVVSAGGAARATVGDEAAGSALETLKGTWVSGAGSITSTWTFEGDAVEATVEGDRYTAKVKADPRAEPAALDFVIREGPPDAKGMTAKCIYKFDGASLILCVSLPGGDRPKEFVHIDDEFYLFRLNKKEKDNVEKPARGPRP
jgi:uncharacterized protein (TIGR03067 family)